MLLYVVACVNNDKFSLYSEERASNLRCNVYMVSSLKCCVNMSKPFDKMCPTPVVSQQTPSMQPLSAMIPLHATNTLQYTLPIDSAIGGLKSSPKLNSHAVRHTPWSPTYSCFTTTPLDCPLALASLLASGSCFRFTIRSYMLRMLEPGVPALGQNDATKSLEPSLDENAFVDC